MSRRFKLMIAVVSILSVLPGVFTAYAPLTLLRIDLSTPEAQNGFKAIDVGTIGKNGQATCHWPDTTPYLLRLFQKWRGISSTTQTGNGFFYDGEGGIGLWVSPSWLPKGVPGAPFRWEA